MTSRIMDQLAHHDRVFAAANKHLLSNNFQGAITLYQQQYDAGGNENPGVVQNLALALALDGQAADSMHLLESNMSAHRQYAKSYKLAAELYLRAALRDEHAAPGLLETASALLKKAFECDLYDPQACIIASEILTCCEDSQQQAIEWHIKALGAIKARGSKLVENFSAVMLENFADEAVHFFRRPPVKPHTTGSLSDNIKSDGRCLVIVSNNERCPCPDGWEDWPKLHVTYGQHPRTTGNGQVHVRTALNWAAVFEASVMALDPEIHTATVWNADRCSECPEPHHLLSEALVHVCHGPLDVFCMRPSSHQELCILKALYSCCNVPPSKPTESMALQVWSTLVKDSCLDVTGPIC